MIEVLELDPSTCGNPQLFLHAKHLQRRDREAKAVAIHKAVMETKAKPVLLEAPARQINKNLPMPVGLAQKLAKPSTPHDAILVTTRPAKLILLRVCAKYGFAIEDMHSLRRPHALVQAKFEAYWLMKRNTGCGLPTIGREMGGRDHTSVMHGIRRYEEALASLRNGTFGETHPGWDAAKMIREVA